MINDKRMKYIKSEDGMDYYIFSPSLIRQYYNNSEEWTKHRKSLTHKLHMMLYHLRGGYQILYMMDGMKIASYIVFARCGKTVIEGSTIKDIFTVFVTTHPDYRRRGYASKIVNTMLHDIGLKYDISYKTILDSNIGSQKAAIANGYEVLYPAQKTRILKTISKAEDGDWKLYSYSQKQ